MDRIISTLEKLENEGFITCIYHEEINGYFLYKSNTHEIVIELNDSPSEDGYKQYDCNIIELDTRRVVLVITIDLELDETVIDDTLIGELYESILEYFKKM